METSPVIPDKIISQFKYAFHNSEEFTKISKPEICDVLVSTDSFRNPWYSEENREKRSVEMQHIKQMMDQKKREVEERQMSVVRDFKKTFYNLNHREPVDFDINDNNRIYIYNKRGNHFVYFIDKAKVKEEEKRIEKEKQEEKRLKELAKGKQVRFRADCNDCEGKDLPKKKKKILSEMQQLSSYFN